MKSEILISSAEEKDCSDLALLSDAATRRLNSFMWSNTARVGQSWFEVGREFIRTQADHFSHYSNWHIAKIGSRSIGAMNCYLLPIRVEDDYISGSPAVIRPLNELKMVGGGTWYVAVASVFPEFRGHGVGTALLSKAEEMAKVKQLPGLTLMVGSFNTEARRLYERFGFAEWEKRSFVPFHSSDPEGEWILMRKIL